MNRLESHDAERIWKLSIPLLLFGIDMIWLRIESPEDDSKGYELAVHFWKN